MADVGNDGDTTMGCGGVGYRIPRPPARPGAVEVVLADERTTVRAVFENLLAARSVRIEPEGPVRPGQRVTLRPTPPTVVRDLESILFKTEEYGNPVFVVEPAEVERGDDSLLGFTIPADTAPAKGSSSWSRRIRAPSSRAA